jgi:phosphoribosylanthranilate isomerase
MRVRVKVCGITRVEDALAAAELGVDAVGFNFAEESPRCVEPATARSICDALPPLMTRVGVLVNASAATISLLAREAGVEQFQFHGEESPEECAASPLPWFKAFRVGPDFSLDTLERYQASAHLLDAFHPQARGGTGEPADWSVAAQAAGRFRIILAGGLGPDNILSAVESVGPTAVDVNSGVESAPGVKDHARLARLMSRLAEGGYR